MRARNPAPARDGYFGIPCPYGGYGFAGSRLTVPDRAQTAIMFRDELIINKPWPAALRGIGF